MSIYSIMAFNSAINQMKQNEQDSQSIQQAKAKTESMQNDLDIAKRTKESGIKLANDQNLLSDYQAKTMIDAYSDSYKHANDHLNAISEAQDKAQHDTQVKSQQAAQIAQQLHASDPDVQNHVSTMLQGMNAANGNGSPPISTSQQTNAASFATPTLQAGEQSQVNKDKGGQLPSIFPINNQAPQMNSQQTLGLFGSSPSAVTGSAQGMDAQARAGAAKPDTQPINNAPSPSAPQEQQPAGAAESNSQENQAEESPIQGVTSRLEKIYGMPQGSMWIDPSTGKPGMNPFYMKKAEAKLTAQAHVEENQPNVDRDYYTKNAETAENYIESSLKSSRSPVGQQDIKVNAAIHAIQAIDQSYDKKTGQFDITQVPYSELAENLGNLLSGGTGSSEGRINAIKQATLQGDFNKALTYFTGKPTNATSQEALQQLTQLIIRQGQVSENLRNNAIENIKKNNPIFNHLLPEDLDAINQQKFGNSFQDELNNTSFYKGSQNNNESESPRNGKGSVSYSKFWS